jgi:predicted dehydrogenase
MTRRIGIIGCGKQAEKHLQGYRKHGVTDITLVDIDPARAESMATAQGVSTARSLDALFARGVDGLDICTPTPAHFECAKAALEAGVPFLVEKPLTSSAEQAAILQKLSQDTGVPGAVGFTYRFVPAFRHFREVIGAGELGEMISATLRIGGRGSQAAWKHRRAEGGGAVREMLVHMLDLASWVMGPVASFSLLDVAQRQPTRMIAGVETNVDAEDWITLTDQHESGAVTTLVCDFTTPSFIQYAEFQGRAGSAFGSIQPHLPAVLVKAADTPGYARGSHPLNLGAADLVADMIGNYLGVIDGTQSPVCSLADAASGQRLLDEVLAAAHARL